MDYPGYSYPPCLFAKIVRDILLLRHRSFRLDAKACIEKLNPPLQVLGRENIPGHGPCVITINHYHRTGFGAQWLAFAVAASLPADMHWIMTGEFTYPEKLYELFGGPGSRILLKRIARVYGFTTMPPMPPRPRDVKARAASVRGVLKYVRYAEDPILGLAPEGYDTPHGELVRPATGLGRFGLLLSKAGLKFIPVGAYEAAGFFYLHFGRPYQLNLGRELPADEKDEQAVQIIMKNIARLLPPYLKGEFVEET